MYFYADFRDDLEHSRKRPLSARAIHKAMSKAHIKETSKKLAILAHAEASKAYEKAPDGYKSGHAKALQNAMTDMLKMENKL